MLHTPRLLYETGAEDTPTSAVLCDWIGVYCDTLDDDVGHGPFLLSHGRFFDNVQDIQSVDHLNQPRSDDEQQHPPVVERLLKESSFSRAAECL